eukprot:gene6542-10548_t
MVVLFAYKSYFAGVILIASFIFIGIGFGSSLTSLTVMGHHFTPNKESMGRNFAVIHQCMSLGQIIRTIVGGQILGWIKLYSTRFAYVILLSTTCFCLTNQQIISP